MLWLLRLSPVNFRTGECPNLASPLGADLSPRYPHTFLISFDTLAYIMVLLDEKQSKWEAAPPPYIELDPTTPTTSLHAAAAAPPISRPHTRVTFMSLPQHILLEVIQSSVAPEHTSWIEHRLALWWLSTDLRLVCRAIYTGASVPQPGIPDSLKPRSMYAHPPIDLSPGLRITYQVLLHLRPVPAIYAFTARLNLYSALPPAGNDSARPVYTREDKGRYQIR